MIDINKYPGICGLYEITNENRLNYYLSNGESKFDSKLSTSFESYISKFLKLYSQNRLENIKLGVLVGPNKSFKSKTSAIIFEDEILKHLYITHGTIDSSKLTGLQEKKKTQSVYKGIELLLNIKERALISEKYLEVPKYCPVLYFNNPNFEFLNLIAPLSSKSRTDSNIYALLKAIEEGVVDKSLRKGQNLELLN